MVFLLPSFRGLFIIDPNGVVKHMSVNDLPVGRCVEETLRLVKAFQFVETHGEVCPASWTPESPTVSSLDTFQSTHLLDRTCLKAFHTVKSFSRIAYKLLCSSYISHLRQNRPDLLYVTCFSDQTDPGGIQRILWKSQLTEFTMFPATTAQI